MELGCPELLEPPEDIFSTGSFLELGFNGPASKVPVTRVQEQGLQSWEMSRGCSPGCSMEVGVRLREL
jgi:cyclic AMP-responsive element-binding protein 3